MKREMIYEGKAKKVFASENQDQLIVYYKDDATAFNGEKKGTINNKGELNNKISSFFFNLLTEKGIPNHFIRQLDERQMLVKNLKILPVEVVVRNIAAGNLAKRIGWEEGRKMPVAVVELYYKNDRLGDPLINNYHIQAMGLADESQVKKMEEYALKINGILTSFLKGKNIDLIDFKLEFGVYKDELILGDEISPDTCRFWDAATGDKLDKDRFRRDLGKVEDAYQEILKRLIG